jgi:hypothetical protein
MRTILLTAVAALSFGTVGAAQAGPFIFRLPHIANCQHAESTSGSGNKATICSEDSYFPFGGVVQNGKKGDVKVLLEDGFDNNFFVWQTDSSWKSDAKVVQQGGKHNDALIVQQGDYSSANIGQKGGEHNDAVIWQTVRVDGSDATISQVGGKRNDAAIIQNSDRNNAEIAQVGGRDNTAVIVQDDNGSSAAISQTGGAGGTLFIVQD